mmetsp:Transcript_17801/g.32236  ORF Transcript_17801/g.32236 Transcript_17801/m.32236 type:complete len:97 (+) Transcript_17801:526-816(+)
MCFFASRPYAAAAVASGLQQIGPRRVESHCGHLWASAVPPEQHYGNCSEMLACDADGHVHDKACLCLPQADGMVDGSPRVVQPRDQELLGAVQDAA